MGGQHQYDHYRGCQGHPYHTHGQSPDCKTAGQPQPNVQFNIINVYITNTGVPSQPIGGEYKPPVAGPVSKPVDKPVEKSPVNKPADPPVKPPVVSGPVDPKQGTTPATGSNNSAVPVKEDVVYLVDLWEPDVYEKIMNKQDTGKASKVPVGKAVWYFPEARLNVMNCGTKGLVQFPLPKLPPNFDWEGWMVDVTDKDNAITVRSGVIKGANTIHISQLIPDKQGIILPVGSAAVYKVGDNWGKVMPIRRDELYSRIGDEVMTFADGTKRVLEGRCRFYISSAPVPDVQLHLKFSQNPTQKIGASGQIGGAGLVAGIPIGGEGVDGDGSATNADGTTAPVDGAATTTNGTADPGDDPTGTDDPASTENFNKMQADDPEIPIYEGGAPQDELTEQVGDDGAAVPLGDQPMMDTDATTADEMKREDAAEAPSTGTAGADPSASAGGDSSSTAGGASADSQGAGGASSATTDPAQGTVSASA